MLRLFLPTLIAAIALGQPVSLPAGGPDGHPLLTSQHSSGEITGWKSFSEDAKTKTGDVWTLGADGILVCKGKPLGYLYTDKNYTDFALTLQWRTPPGGKPGNGGVLLRMTGKHKIWPKSLEAQLNARDEGDFWGLDGYQLTGPADRLKSLEHPQFGKLTNLKKTKWPVKAPGEWNLYEIVAHGPRIILKINGEEVNQASQCDLVAGPICLTAEGDEIHFRDIRLLETK
ncbi:MAG: DUF1080 domain-containing protein [Thermoguttaceae bacterium]|jgi:hypothetical protein